MFILTTYNVTNSGATTRNNVPYLINHNEIEAEVNVRVKPKEQSVMDDPEKVATLGI